MTFSSETNLSPLSFPVERFLPCPWKQVNPQLKINETCKCKFMKSYPYRSSGFAHEPCNLVSLLLSWTYTWKSWKSELKMNEREQDYYWLTWLNKERRKINYQSLLNEPGNIGWMLRGSSSPIGRVHFLHLVNSVEPLNFIHLLCLFLGIKESQGNETVNPQEESMRVNCQAILKIPSFTLELGLALSPLVNSVSPFHFLNLLCRFHVFDLSPRKQGWTIAFHSPIGFPMSFPSPYGFPISFPEPPPSLTPFPLLQAKTPYAFSDSFFYSGWTISFLSRAK